MTLAERLAAKTVRTPSGCLEWTGTRTPPGYGIIRVGGRRRYVHRVAWELKHGPIPPGLLVRHSCDNPPCVETEHLLTGNRLDNVTDMHQRGRAARHIRQRSTGEFRLDRESPEPIFRQIATIIRDRIHSGEYQPDDVIPSIEYIRVKADCTVVTVRKGIGLLAQEGYVRLVPGHGTFVNPPEEWAP